MSKASHDIGWIGIGRMGEASGVPVGLYAQGPGGTALAVAIEAARAGADPIATASYPVAMLTQQDDRPNHRSPWHVLESFELGDWIHALDPDLDTYQVETVLREAIPFIRDTLDPTDHDA